MNAVSGAGGLAVDVHPALVPSGGIGRYVRDLVHALSTLDGAPPARLVHPRGLGDEARRRFPGAARHELPLGWRGLRVAYGCTIPLGLPLDRWFGGAHVYHATMAIAPVLARIPLVVTVHDLTAIEHPEWHPAPVVSLARWTLPSAIRRATTVVCDSEHVRRRVLARYSVPADRVVTVPLAVSPGFRPVEPAAARALVQRRLGLAGEYVLHVGTLEPRKNHATLLAAFDALVAAGFPGRLVLVGRDGWHCQPIFERLGRMRARDRVLRVTDADDETLAALYTAATAMALPSWDEGFGLPLLEAMAHGCPCACSDGGSLPEVAGQGAMIVPAGDAAGLAGALGRLWSDAQARSTQVERGLRRAGEFAFEPWARAMFGIYSGAAGAAASSSWRR